MKSRIILATSLSLALIGWAQPMPAAADSKTKVEEKSDGYKMETEDGAVKTKYERDDDKIKQEYEDKNCKQKYERDLEDGKVKVETEGDCN